jgi:hypothetical protein
VPQPTTLPRVPIKQEEDDKYKVEYITFNIISAAKYI